MCPNEITTWFRSPRTDVTSRTSDRNAVYVGMRRFGLVRSHSRTSPPSVAEMPHVKSVLWSLFRVMWDTPRECPEKERRRRPVGASQSYTHT